MLNWEVFENAVGWAVQYHFAQIDKKGKPFLLHPLRVALRADDPLHATVGVLHDIIEDTPLSLDALATVFGKDVRDAVDAISRRKEETYEAYILRCKQNPVARQVKKWDIADNLARLHELEEGERINLSKRYHQALIVLNDP